MASEPHFAADGKDQDLSPELDVYTEHFGLGEKPFHVTPDPRFFYPSPAYQEAYASLLYGIRQRKGFIVLTGEVGTGKTTLLRRLMTNLGDSVHFAFVYNTTWTFDEILDAICSDFELPIGGVRRVEKVQALNMFLLKRLEQGEITAVLIDEAHNLSIEALENLRLLSNLETGREKLLQIVLVGQNELELKLAQFALRQLKDRVAIWCRLDRLKEREVGPFIFHRLRTVGYDNQDLFTPDAIQRIAVYSQGSPRQINIICDNALLLAYGTYQKRVSSQIVEEVAQDLLLKDGVGQVANRTSTVAPLLSEPLEVTPPLQEGSASTTSATSEVTFTATAANKEENQRGEASFQPRLNRVASIRIAIGLVFLFSVAGLWVLQSSGEHSPFSPWLAFVKHSLTPWLAAETGSLGEQSEAVSQPTVRTGEVFKPVAQNSPQPTPAPLPAVREHESSVTSKELANQGLPPQPVPSLPDRNGQLVTVPRGATVLDLVSQMYAERTLLALGLIKELNPHINDLNKVSQGEQLRMPTLTRETLLRRQPDGSFHLMLSAFRQLRDAERLARTLRRQGYVALISPQRVSETTLLYRVAIAELEGTAATERAWKLFNTQNAVPAAHPVAR
ncbi:MAG TPA: AAA family ATPase [Candidatus Binatia bacterium]|nr:AAA family ATPase [Candidatus Binatia bacterium]